MRGHKQMRETCRLVSSAYKAREARHAMQRKALRNGAVGIKKKNRTRAMCENSRERVAISERIDDRPGVHATTSDVKSSRLTVFWGTPYGESNPHSSLTACATHQHFNVSLLWNSF
jgi:hypothetical protein